MSSIGIPTARSGIKFAKRKYIFFIADVHGNYFSSLTGLFCWLKFKTSIKLCLNSRCYIVLADRFYHQLKKKLQTNSSHFFPPIKNLKILEKE